MNISTALDHLFASEGGYSNHPSDPGGETMWGITARVARAAGYSGAMRELPKTMAATIYRKNYWEPCQIDRLPPELQFQVFDAAVNSGVTQAIRWMQKTIGATPDGAIGPETLIKIESACAQEDGNLIARFNAIRLEFLTNLNTWPSFGKGWSRRIAKNLTIEE